MKTAITIIALAGAAVGIAAILNTGLDRQAKVDCLQWQSQATQYPGFYLTQWQKDQCDSVGITINAPIK